MKTIRHIPHASRHIPEKYIDQLVLSAEDLDHEMLAMTDAFADELFGTGTADDLVFPVSRLLVDPERFVGDEETMNAVGMGAIYELTHKGKPLRRKLSDQERKELLQEFYYPHHRRLEDMAEIALSHHSGALILDCHSYPALAQPWESHKQDARPEICIGTDPFHTPPYLMNAFTAAFSDSGYTVDVNKPFRGTIVPTRFFNKEKKISSIMVELRRDLYMNELTGEKLGCFDKVRKDVWKALAGAVEIISRKR